MPLESHFEEARAFLAAVVISALDMPEHWYAPMLPADHPSSFCKLSGLTTEELNLVMEASGFVVKRSKNSMRRDVIVMDRRFVSYADAVCRGSFTPNQHFKMSGDDILGHLTYRSTSSQNKSKQQ
jgi:hypothetical protein